jgi:hypothetical protein
VVKTVGNLYPGDAVLNLPAGRHSAGLARLAALEAARGSFDAAGEAIERATGVRPGKRQVEDLARAAAVDVDAFYATRRPTGCAGDRVLVLRADGKGIVMRPGGLREATARTAAATTGKLATRLSPGEKRGRKRMAEIGAVHDLTPVPRTVDDVIPAPGQPRCPPQRGPGPVAAGKWLTASVTDDIPAVIKAVFDEAERRDRAHARTWVALVDGNPQQITAIQDQAAARGVTVTIVLDVVHVLEYVSAPRGARLYPPLSGERLEGLSLDPMAYLDSKGIRGKQHAIEPAAVLRCMGRRAGGSA